MKLSRDELVEAAYNVTGGNLEDLSLDQVVRLITITQHVTDLCINEIERRGALTFSDGAPMIPYHCEYMVPTVLTRPSSWSKEWK